MWRKNAGHCQFSQAIIGCKKNRECLDQDALVSTVIEVSVFRFCTPSAPRPPDPSELCVCTRLSVSPIILFPWLKCLAAWKRSCLAAKGTCSVAEMALWLLQWKDGWDCLVDLAWWLLVRLCLTEDSPGIMTQFIYKHSWILTWDDMYWMS